MKRIETDFKEQEIFIGQLKQIIKIQDNLYRSEAFKLDSGFHDQIQKDLKGIVDDPNMNTPRSKQLASVKKVSELLTKQTQKVAQNRDKMKFERRNSQTKQVQTDFKQAESDKPETKFYKENVT